MVLWVHRNRRLRVVECRRGLFQVQTKGFLFWRAVKRPVRMWSVAMLQSMVAENKL